MTPARTKAERDGLLALLSQVRYILHKWNHPYIGPHASNCIHAVAELRRLLEPDHPQEDP